jgi:NAD-dependent deacetylase
MSALHPRTLAPNVGRAARLLGAARQAVALTGAGLSTPSGIPDFRSPGLGLWEDYDPLEVASLDGFRQDPGAFYSWIRPLARLMLGAEPNAAHLALAELEARGRLRAVLTQNIDQLHSRAGSRCVLELHGHIREAACLECGHRQPALGLLEQLVEDGRTPHCPDCGGVLKPNVVLFGEALPEDVWREAHRLARACDLILVAGSSLEVAPAGDLPLLARQAGARLIIVNRQPTPLDDEAEIVIHADVAEALPAIVAELQAGEARHG